MSLPQWNSEWEKPDPLRGARGWMLHHYASVVTAAVLFFVTLGLLAPVVVKARRTEYDADRTYEQLQAAIAEAAGEPRGLR